MNSKLKYSEYKQVFSTLNTSYLATDIFMTHYKRLYSLMYFNGESWKAFLPKKIIEETLIEGLKLFKSKKLFNDFENNLFSFYNKAELFFKSISKK